MRTTINLKCGSVHIDYDDVDGERVSDVFSCPDAGGYVRNGQGKQVCDNLSRMGNTLTATSDTLLEVIRSEYRSMRRKEKREVDKYGFR